VVGRDLVRPSRIGGAQQLSLGERVIPQEARAPTTPVELFYGEGARGASFTLDISADGGVRPIATSTPNKESIIGMSLSQ
jgi:hypothetical protein